MRETVSASRKLGKADAARLVREATHVIVAKGRKVDRFEPGGRAQPDAVAALLGPTGNLRAPTLLVGKTLLVGFDESAYRDVLLSPSRREEV